MYTNPDDIDQQLVDTTLQPLLDMWRARASDGLPAWQDFDILELRPWVGRLTLVELLPNENDILWRVFGTIIAERLQRDMTGFRYTERPDWVAETVFDVYWDVAKTAVPALHIIDDQDLEGRSAGLLRLMLPLAAESGGKDVALIVTAYEDADELTRRQQVSAG